jgi:hypothetical protein
MYKHSAALLALILLQTEALRAKEIGLPPPGPVLSLDIPDDWTLESSDIGLEAASPEKNSYLFMKILKRPGDDPNQWVRAVKERLLAHGITFGTPGAGPAKEAKAEPGSPATHEPSGNRAAKPAAPAQSPVVSVLPALAAPVAPGPVAAAAPEISPPAAPPSATAAPTPPPVAASAPEAPAPAAPATSSEAVAQAAVSPKPPEVPSVPVQEAQAAPPVAAAPAPEDNKPAEAPVLKPIPFFAEAASAAMPPAGVQAPRSANPPRSNQLPRFPRHVLSYNDASFDGKPVDLQLVTAILPNHSILFIIQESGSTDARAITAINSLRPVK